MPSTPTPPKTIAQLLREQVYPLVATDLESRTIVGANDAAYELLGRTSPSLEGAPVKDIVGKNDWPAVEVSMSLLASGALEGYQAVRLFRRADGQEFKVNVWVRSLNVDGRKLGLSAVEAEMAEIPWHLTQQDHITIAGIVTDHDWIIEMVSSDIETILGFSPESYKGRSVLGLLQPRDVQKFMSAVDRITADGGGATLRVHLRDANGRWKDVLLLMVAMCGHTPPRLGLAITDPEGNVGMTRDSRQQLAARSGDVLDGVERFRLAAESERFSTRQSEILTRLLRGERVQHIAKDLYLSPSTVRNHLTAIYRKFGVHTQAELLAKLLRDPSALGKNP
jgi:PAS domain S-box-containing protein